jgi:hypothetical protein
MPGVTRWLVVFCSVAAASQAAYIALRILITYRALDLGLGVVAGWRIGRHDRRYAALVAVPIGRMADRGAARRTIIWSTVLTVVGGGIVAGSVSVGLLVLGSVVLSWLTRAGRWQDRGMAPSRRSEPTWTRTSQRGA